MSKKNLRTHQLSTGSASDLRHSLSEEKMERTHPKEIKRILPRKTAGKKDSERRKIQKERQSKRDEIRQENRDLDNALEGSNRTHPKEIRSILPRKTREGEMEDRRCRVQSERNSKRDLMRMENRNFDSVPEGDSKTHPKEIRRILSRKTRDIDKEDRRRKVQEERQSERDLVRMENRDLDNVLEGSSKTHPKETRRILPKKTASKKDSERRRVQQERQVKREQMRWENRQDDLDPPVTLRRSQRLRDKMTSSTPKPPSAASHPQPTPPEDSSPLSWEECLPEGDEASSVRSPEEVSSSGEAWYSSEDKSSSFQGVSSPEVPEVSSNPRRLTVFLNPSSRRCENPNFDEELEEGEGEVCRKVRVVSGAVGAEVSGRACTLHLDSAAVDTFMDLGLVRELGLEAKVQMLDEPVHVHGRHVVGVLKRAPLYIYFSTKLKKVDILVYSEDTSTKESTYHVTTGPGSGSDTSRSGSEIVTSESGSESVTSESGSEAATSWSGNKSVTSRSGSESVTSGSGRECVTSGSGSGGVTSRSGSKSVTSRSGSASVTSGSVSENVTSRSGSESATSGSGIESVTSRSGRESVTSRSGSESVTSGSGSESVPSPDSSPRSPPPSSSSSSTSRESPSRSGSEGVTSRSGSESVTSRSGSESVTSGSGSESVPSPDSSPRSPSSSSSSSSSTARESPSLSSATESDGGRRRFVMGCRTMRLLDLVLIFSPEGDLMLLGKQELKEMPRCCRARSRAFNIMRVHRNSDFSDHKVKMRISTAVKGSYISKSYVKELKEDGIKRPEVLRVMLRSHAHIHTTRLQEADLEGCQFLVGRDVLRKYSCVVDYRNKWIVFRMRHNRSRKVVLRKEEVDHLPVV